MAPSPAGNDPSPSGPTSVTEGTTRILAPPAPKASPVPGPRAEPRGPMARSRDAPFYNPAMALNRDLSVLLVDAFAAERGRQLDFADALAGSGARSLRIANECRADVVVHANDGDPKAVAAIRTAARANGVPSDRLAARHGHAHGFLAERRFDVVDVDPFGSPAPFLDAAVRATRHDGLVCLTATDTAALAGTYRKACRRRYGAEPLHPPPWRAEVGLRILQGAVVRAAGRLDRAAAPGLAVARGHWMRVVMHIRDGRRAADRAAAEMGSVEEEPETGSGRSLPTGTGRLSVPAGAAGPLWLGPLHDARLVAAMQAAATDRAAHEGRPRLADEGADRLLAHLVEEADAPAWWVPLPGLPQRLGLRDTPRRDRLSQALRDAGYAAARTHMDPQGLRTDADADALRAAIKDAAPR